MVSLYASPSMIIMNMEFTEINEDVIRGIRLDRDEYADKRAFGHALLIAGSKGMMGAAVLAAGAALRSGCGLVTAHIPEDERMIMQAVNPAAIVRLDPGTAFSEIPDNLEHYTAAGVGCGMGQSEATVEAFSALLSRLSCQAMPFRDIKDRHREAGSPVAETGQGHGKGRKARMPGMVLDADALNIIAAHPELASIVPSGSILTPHTRELSRLVAGLCNVRDVDFSGWKYPWDGPQLYYTMSIADSLSSVVIVKGSRTLVCPPPDMANALKASLCRKTGLKEYVREMGGRLLYVNTTGNAGMAKGGSGDVLTGLVTGLRARGYSPLEAAILGVWYHGRAGDDAARVCGAESMNASDLLDHIMIQ